MTEFPNFLRNQDEIYWLQFFDNQIHGDIPQWAWEAWNDLFILALGSNKFSSIGYAPLLPLNIQLFDLSNNMFEGPIPIPQGSAIMLDYSSNMFSSVPSNFSSHLSDVNIFKASDNKLSGKMASSFCGATSLTLLDLSYSNFDGSIPPCLTEDATVLQVLNLEENKLHGEFPDSDISGNRIEGKLPRSLVACENLEVVDVGSNQISDSFPCWMSRLHKLQVLGLKSNKIFGQVAQSLAKERDTCDFPSVRIVDLASNNFSGPLPQDQWFKKLKSMMVRDSNTTPVMDHDVPQMEQAFKFAVAVTYKGNTITFSTIFSALVLIDVSNNAFHGSIPEALTELVLVCGLNMSHNALTGPIPSQLGRLNLSGNKLEGRIPESPHFLTFSNSSFMGNTGLCGPPLSKQCGNATTPYLVPHNPKKESADVMLFLFTGLGFGVGFAVVIAVGWVLPIRKKF